MGVFTFVCRNSGGEWNAKQHEGDLEASASSTYELQRKLVQTALSADSSGGVQTSFSLITPTSAVCQVVVGGAVGGGFVAGGAAPGGGAGGASEAAAAPKEEKKEEVEEEEEGDFGFSLFD
ncbi:PREDICTED: 60S acidic ribosomal protein P3-1-like [Tarenaya hassleriana]|uniref:60S acidic ribosomal protein P3-1-like n=1 Tax=Tarenaya hassleriana TaxID=28532 RepID=UPI00053C2D4F|nr:PREDICTED: 60S acidic ribosomal protein P3-1-like [Tarenaya hassleriana]